MPFPLNLCRTGLTLAALAMTGIPARALLNIDGTKNQIFVFGGLAFSQDSNIFSQQDGEGDYHISAHTGAEWKRRAGIIAVDAEVRIDFTRYGEFKDEDAVNPSLSVEFSKSTGRTTGALKIAALRESRAESAVNLRTNSWNVPVELSLRYPINEKLYVTSNTGYLRRDYRGAPALLDYNDLSEAVDLYYVYSSKLDLVGGYRIRSSRTADDRRSLDHWFSLGATGGLFSKMTGTVRFGYQVRELRGADDYGQLNASAAVNWPVTRKVVLSLSGTRDFTTIATGSSIDTSTAGLTALYTYSRKLDFRATLSAGRNKFLNESTPRADDFFSMETGVRYRMNDHLEMGANFVYLRNSSTLALANFDNRGFSLDVSSRY